MLSIVYWLNQSTGVLVGGSPTVPRDAQKHKSQFRKQLHALRGSNQPSQEGTPTTKPISPKHPRVRGNEADMNAGRLKQYAEIGCRAKIYSNMQVPPYPPHVNQAISLRLKACQAYVLPSRLSCGGLPLYNKAASASSKKNPYLEAACVKKKGEMSKSSSTSTAVVCPEFAFCLLNVGSLSLHTCVFHTISGVLKRRILASLF